MNYKSFNLGDWIGHISGVIEDETTLDGNEMRDLVEFLSTLEPCEDAISRQAAISHVDDVPYIKEHPNVGLLWKAWIESLPSAQPERKKGKWERHYSRPNVYADLFWHCSECGYKDSENYAPVYHHFCPNCGAKMEETNE